MKTVIKFKDTWHAKTLIAILSIQMLIGIYSFSMGRYNTISLLLLILLSFIWLSALTKSPSFINLGGYYMMVIGYFLGTSVSDLFKYTNNGNPGKVIEEIIDVNLLGLLGYLLWNRNKFTTKLEIPESGTKTE